MCTLSADSYKTSPVFILTRMPWCAHNCELISAPEAWSECRFPSQRCANITKVVAITADLQSCMAQLPIRWCRHELIITLVSRSRRSRDFNRLFGKLQNDEVALALTYEIYWCRCICLSLKTINEVFFWNIFCKWMHIGNWQHLRSMWAARSG